MLFVPGLGHGAWAFAEHWLAHTAGRGFAAHAMSLRGTAAAATLRALRAYATTWSRWPRPCRARRCWSGTVRARWWWRGRWRATRPGRRCWSRRCSTAGPASARRCGATRSVRCPPRSAGRLRLNRRQLFSRELPAERADEYRARLAGAGRGRPVAAARAPGSEPPVGRPPVLVVGSPDDRVVAGTSLDRAAARYGGAPLLFPGMGHDMMLDAGWQEPIDAILDWLVKELAR